MHHQEFPPPEILTDTIKCFWYDNRNLGKHLTGFDVPPDGYAEIIFHFGSGCSIARNGALQQLPSPFLMGLQEQSVTFYAKDVLEIIGIRCFPWTVFDLLGLQPGKGGLHLSTHPIAQLHPALQACIRTRKIEEAVVVVQQYFLAASTQVAGDSLLHKAGIAMQSAKGTMPVKQVAAAAHATVRTLERKFRKSSGHTVKDVSALMRFEQVRNRLWTQPGANLTALAYELGYADQSHLNREFKRYSGSTPGAFARNARKNKQFFSDNFVAFVQD